MFKIIIDKIFDILFAPFYIFVDKIPTIDPFNGADISNNLVGIINNVSCFVPVITFFQAISIWFILANFDFTVSVIHWVVRKIPGVD